MRVLFLPIFTSTPHLETELELMKNHLDLGDDVFVLRCNANLETCFANPYHEKNVCNFCKSRLNEGIKLIKSPKLKILNYPKIKINYSNIPNKFNSIIELKEFELDGVSVGLAAASSLITRNNRDHKLSTLDHSEEVKREVQNSHFLAKIFERSISLYKPDLVYIFNGRISTAAPVIDVCKMKRIDFKVHERGGQIGRYNIIDNGIPHDVDIVYKEIEKMWDNYKGDQALKIGSQFFIDRRNKVEQGWYSFTNEQKQNLLPESFSNQRKNIVFFNSTIEEYAAVKGWNKPLFLFKDEIDALENILDFFKEDSSKYFYLRVHPNLRNTNNTQTRELKKLNGKYPNFEIIAPESPIDSYSLIDNADSIVVFGSTVGIEAAFWNKPSIVLGKTFYNNVDAVYIPDTLEELYNMINSDLKPKSKLGAIKYGFWELNKGYEFNFFNQENLTSGKFLGKEIKGSYFNKFQSFVLKIKAIIIKVIPRKKGTLNE